MTISLTNKNTSSVPQSAQYSATTPQPESSDTTLSPSKTTVSTTSNALVVYQTRSVTVVADATAEAIKKAYDNAVKNSKIYIAKKTGPYCYEIIEMPKTPEICPTCGPQSSSLKALICWFKSTQRSTTFSEICWTSPDYNGYEPLNFHGTQLLKLVPLFTKVSQKKQNAWDPVYKLRCHITGEVIKDKNGKPVTNDKIYHDEDPEVCAGYASYNLKNKPIVIGVAYQGRASTNDAFGTNYSLSANVKPISCRAVTGQVVLNPFCQPAKYKVKSMVRSAAWGASVAVGVGTGTLGYHAYNKYRSQPSTPSIALAQPVTTTRQPITDGQFDAFA